MRLVIAAALSLLFVACAGEQDERPEPLEGVPFPADPISGTVQTIDIPGCFSLRLPTDMIDLEVQGIDSTVGHWLGSDLGAKFDCGAFGVSFGEPGPVSTLLVDVEGYVGSLEHFERDYMVEELHVTHVYVLSLSRPGGELFDHNITVWVEATSIEQESLALGILASVSNLWL